MYIVHYIPCDATKVHFTIILIITQVPSMKLIKLVFSRRLITAMTENVMFDHLLTLTRTCVKLLSMQVQSILQFLLQILKAIK